MKKTLILQEFEEFSIKWYKILHRQATRKEERNYITLHFDTDCEIALLCQKKDSYTDSVYSKDTLGTILTISQRFFFSEFPFTDPIFHRIDPPLFLYMNMWSSACLEARENVLLLILLPVFDTGSFIANLYLPYLLYSTN